MATTTVASDNHPRWTKQGAHWVEISPSSSSSRTTSARSSMEARPAPLDTDVLLNILKVLRKLDCKMEVQGRRLEILETTSPTSNACDTLVNSSPISRKQSTRTAASKTTLLPSSEAEDMNDYARSILKMDYAIDEATSVAEVSLDGSEKVDPAHSTWTDLVSEPRDYDLYSVSMYTGDVLGSRMSLDMLRQSQAVFTPPIQRAPSSQELGASDDDEIGNHSMGLEGLPRVSDDYRDTGVQTVHVGTVAINTKETKTSPASVKMELLFHAVNNWRGGVVSKIKHESKSLWEDEKRRLSEFRQSHRTKDFVQRVVDKLGSALENEWRDKKERMKSLQSDKKRGVGIMGWRIHISIRSMLNVSRESSVGEVVC